MESIFITGAGGFVGTNFISYFKDDFEFVKYNRIQNIDISQDFILHFAGKAHDLKKVSKPEEYYQVNTELTKQVFDAFISSNAKVFIAISSVKAVADDLVGILREENVPNPITHYGKSKLLAEEYILSREIPEGKRVYILRPCMIHGPGNKGNLNLLFGLVSKGFPWPLGEFNNSRSYCSIENLCFIIKELIDHNYIPSGVYNIADDLPLSTNAIISLIAEVKGKKAWIMNINKSLIKKIAQVGDLLRLPLNSERLQKLTGSYVVSNDKIKKVIGKPLPVSSAQGLLRTFKSFSANG